MAVFTLQQLDDASEVIDFMSYKPLDEYDSWYPEIKELEERITGDSVEDALFLMWLTNPAGKLTEGQETIRKHINKMLYRPEIVAIAEQEM